MYRLTKTQAVEIMLRFCQEVEQGRSFYDAGQALIQSPDERTKTLTKRLLCSQPVRKEIVKILNHGNDPVRPCNPAPMDKVWDLVQGKRATHYYRSVQAQIFGSYDIEIVWYAACNIYGVVHPVVKEKGNGSGDGEVNTTNIIVDGIPHITNSNYNTCSKPYEMCENQVNISQLMNKFRQMVSVHRKHKTKKDTDDGFINPERLVDVVRGTNLDSVRELPIRGSKVDAAVQLHIDASGSMGGHGNRQETACALATALGSAFERLRVPIQIVAFDDSPVLVKDWDDKLRDTKVPHISMGGGTDLPLSMQQCLPSLMKRKEKRKIQVVLTDGRITEANEWWNIIKEYRLRKGYECYGFGIYQRIRDGYFDGKVDAINNENMIPLISREVGKILIHKP
jgi:hypothetical protein